MSNANVADLPRTDDEPVADHGHATSFETLDGAATPCFETTASEDAEIAPDGAVPRSGIDPSDFEDLRRRVDETFKRSSFGRYSGYHPPFSTQYKREIRKLYVDDLPVFSLLDANERATLSRALLLRLLTLGTYVLFALGVACAVASFRGAEMGPLLQAVGATPLYFIGVEEGDIRTALTAVGAYGVLFFLLRRFVRWIMVDKIRQGATRNANTVFRYLSRINNSMDKAIEQSSQDQMYRSGWPERSADWIKIAQWHAKRFEYVDRYVTATAWRIEDRISMVEAVSLGVKLGLVGYVAIAGLGAFGVDWLTTGTENGTVGSIAAISLFVLISIVGWGLLLPVTWVASSFHLGAFQDHDSNNMWVATFLESVEGFDDQRDHIIQKLASVVAGDKTTIMNMRPGAAGD